MTGATVSDAPDTTTVWPFGAMMACCLAALVASGGGAWRLLRRR
jgi:hypothetical protein